MTLVVTTSSSSELVSSSPNSSASSYGKHGSSALLYAMLALFTVSVFFLPKTILSSENLCFQDFASYLTSVCKTPM